MKIYLSTSEIKTTDSIEHFAIYQGFPLVKSKNIRQTFPVTDYLRSLMTIEGIADCYSQKKSTIASGRRKSFEKGLA